MGRVIQTLWKNRKFSKKLGVYLFQRRDNGKETIYRFEVRDRYSGDLVWAEKWSTNLLATVVVGFRTARDIVKFDLYKRKIKTTDKEADYKDLQSTFHDRRKYMLEQ